MLKHYKNVFRDDAQDEIDDLKMIGLEGSIGKPGASDTKSGDEIEASGLGVVGIYVEVGDDERNARDIVNAAWDSYLERNPDVE